MSAWPKKGIHYSKKAAESVGAVQVSVLQIGDSKLDMFMEGGLLKRYRSNGCLGFGIIQRLGPGRSFGSLNGLSPLTPMPCHAMHPFTCLVNHLGACCVDEGTALRHLHEQLLGRFLGFRGNYRA